MNQTNTVTVNGVEILLEDQGDGTFTILRNQRLWFRALPGWVLKDSLAGAAMPEDDFVFLICGLKPDDKGAYPWGELSGNPEYRDFKAKFNWHCNHADKSGGPRVPPTQETVEKLRKAGA